MTINLIGHSFSLCLFFYQWKASNTFNWIKIHWKEYSFILLARFICEPKKQHNFELITTMMMMMMHKLQFDSLKVQHIILKLYMNIIIIIISLFICVVNKTKPIKIYINWNEIFACLMKKNAIEYFHWTNYIDKNAKRLYKNIILCGCWMSCYWILFNINCPQTVVFRLVGFDEDGR